jgi:hypothetical protein
MDPEEKKNVKKREHVRTTSNEGGGREKEREKWIEPKVSAAEWRLRSPDKAEPIETEQEGQQRANVLIFFPLFLFLSLLLFSNRVKSLAAPVADQSFLVLSRSSIRSSTSTWSVGGDCSCFGFLFRLW